MWETKLVMELLKKFNRIVKTFVRIFIPEYKLVAVPDTQKKKIDWIGAVPFLLLHLMCFFVIYVGWSPFAVIFAVVFYLLRMFAITAFYHRYFSHCAFTANRFFAFIFAFLGATAVQRGPLWWAAVHRHHHMHADTEKDIHSPTIQGFWWSHFGWIFARENNETRTEYIKDWMKYRELVVLNKYAQFIPVLFAVLILLTGMFLKSYYPHLGTNGFQLLVWGFFISTVFCSHATFSINSFDHLYGSRRYNTPDTSRNNVIAAIFSLGEGWHNNHHHYAVTAKAGFYWYEIDITYYILVLLSWFRIIKNLRPVPESILGKNRVKETS